MSQRWSEDDFSGKIPTEAEAVERRSEYVCLPDRSDEEKDEVPTWYMLGKPIPGDEAYRVFEENGHTFPDAKAHC